jgi:hypothetical protein
MAYTEHNVICMLDVNWNLKIITLRGNYIVSPPLYRKLTAQGWVILRFER